MKRYLAIVVFLPFLLFTPFLSVHANKVSDEKTELMKAGVYIDDALQAVKNEENSLALEKLQFVSQNLFTKQFDDWMILNFPSEYLVLVETLDRSLQSVQAEELPYKAKVESVMALQLLVNALSTNEEPLWKELEGLITSRFNEAQLAIQSGDSEEIHSAMNELLAVIEIVRPSMSITTNIRNMSKIDRNLSILDEKRGNIEDIDDFQAQLLETKNDVLTIFQSEEQKTLTTSSYWLLLIIGSFIVATLSYVGWKRYDLPTSRHV